MAFLAALLRFVLAALIVLWPNVCCCSFDCAAGSCDADSRAHEFTAEQAHRPGHVNQDVAAEHRTAHEDSDLGRAGDAGGPCRDGREGNGCVCAKSIADLGRLDLTGVDAGASKSLCAWVAAPHFALPSLERANWAASVDLVQSPPPLLYRLRVLRI